MSNSLPLTSLGNLASEGNFRDPFRLFIDLASADIIICQNNKKWDAPQIHRLGFCLIFSAFKSCPETNFLFHRWVSKI
jgi:hypothetical protein